MRRQGIGSRPDPRRGERGVATVEAVLVVPLVLVPVLLGAASTVQPKLAAILAGVYLPEFVLLIVVPLFISTLGRL